MLIFSAVSFSIKCVLLSFYTRGNFNVQALLSVFKGRLLDPRSRDSALERCEVNLQDDEAEGESRLNVKMICKHGTYLKFA